MNSNCSESRNIEGIIDAASALQYVFVALEEQILGLDEDTLLSTKAICHALVIGIQDIPDRIIQLAGPDGIGPGRANAEVQP